MNVFILYKSGIYIQDILGVFKTHDKALLFFREKYKNDKTSYDFDGYHDYYIQEIEIDKAAEINAKSEKSHRLPYKEKTNK